VIRKAVPPVAGLKSYVVIPARLASTRLPRKLLLAETGKPVIQHTYESARRARKPQGICIATDHDEILQAVNAFGGMVRMTSADCASGTDRVAEVARGLPEADIIVNVQGDEPEIAGEAIDCAIELLETSPEINMSTLATPIRCRELLLDPACVKVVFDHRHRAMYFSRSPIPHAREWSDDFFHAPLPVFYQHIGLYAYRREFLLRMATLPPADLEQVEKLEQLRVLAAGHAIAVAVVPQAARGIDTWPDYRAFVDRQLAR
jgi:3-deoxy-manno-octulosonate cytidylyltransferase (CMP-KDO synthetase)